jgi:xylulose-5-phosphate/fructose-6-phosphate phosphoketolase
VTTSPNSETASSAPSLRTVDLWWRAANYLAASQIYLLDNPLLRRPIARDDVKPRLLGHWGTSPALNLVWAHLNRVIIERDLEMIYIAGPGHGGPAILANAWLDGTYSELFPEVSQDSEGLRRLMRQFSFPGGVPSHASADTPGSLHEGGELGYSLVHAYGAVLDNPGLIASCVIGDGEAETATLSASWQLTEFLNPRTDGAVLPILNLNGYKIANPTVLARIPEPQLLSLFRGHGYEPLVVSGGYDGEPAAHVHTRFAAALDAAIDRITAVQAAARNGSTERAVWPVIVLRTPKGWTGPRLVDGLPVENTWRAHQVPLAGVRDNPDHLAQLQAWLESYHPEELFTEAGAPRPELLDLRPRPERRMSASPHANAGQRSPLRIPPLEPHAIAAVRDGGLVESTRVLGGWLRDVIVANPDDFRLFGPDEVASNRLDAVYGVTAKQWEAQILSTDEHLEREGRVIEVLNENLTQGLLEGYLLSGRHGLFTSYEAFIHVVDAMFNQYAKWLESARHVGWRGALSSFTYLLSSHVWRQDHNGFSHQDPGFLNHVVTKSPNVVRVYLPPDANSLLVTAEHCLDSRDHVNVIVAGKHPSPTFLTLEEAREHGARGLGIWEWAGTERSGSIPDAVLACAGDVPTLEAIAAVRLLRANIPELAVRLVNVVDLMRLSHPSQHPHGLDDEQFDATFTVDRPVIFAFHGYPSLVHQLAYKRHGIANFHVRGYSEHGTTTTPFDMLMLNDLDRFRLAMDVIERVPGLRERYAGVHQSFDDARSRHRSYTREVGDDRDDVQGSAGVFAPQP